MGFISNKGANILGQHSSKARLAGESPSMSERATPGLFKSYATSAPSLPLKVLKAEGAHLLGPGAVVAPRPTQNVNQVLCFVFVFVFVLICLWIHINGMHEASGFILPQSGARRMRWRVALAPG